jgi:ABC-type glycerol-3-phosphate transport system permease component
MKVFRYVIGILLTILIVFPFYWIIVSSLKPADQILQPDLFPKSFTLEHYRQLFTQTSFLTNMKNSVIVSVCSMAVNVLIVVPAGFALYRMKFPGRKLISRLILATYIFPGILLLVPVYQMMASLDLVDSLLSLVIINVTFSAPFSIWLMHGFFDAVPLDLDEAASVDGAGRLRILNQIVLPLIVPGIATISIYSFIMAWTEFAFASVLIVDDNLRTLPIGLNAIMGQYTVRWGWTTAGAVLTLLPVAIFFALVGRYFVKGLTQGAVK